MTNIVVLLAALMFAFGVLIGSVLQTHAVHREYLRIAERVRELPQGCPPYSGIVVRRCLPTPQ